MRLSTHTQPYYLQDGGVESTIVRDIADALHSIATGRDATGRQELVVNPTMWLRDQGLRMTPLVVNQAAFFSGTFQRAMETTGRWAKEMEIEGQKIDVYGEFQCRGGSSIPLAALCSWLPTCGAPPEEAPAIFSRLHGAFVQRSMFSADGLPPNLRASATIHNEARVVRVGVEFETGNIASSFRALTKLGLLFRLGRIDVGVFITSSTKGGAATVIWPSSNRNGSFEELSQRRWEDVIDFPVHGIGFAPDRLDTSAPVLRADGNHQVALRTGVVKTLGMRTYTQWQYPGESNFWYTPV